MPCNKFQDYAESISIQERTKLFYIQLECRKITLKIQDTLKMFKKNLVV